jgi:plastocyanin
MTTRRVVSALLASAALTWVLGPTPGGADAPSQAPPPTVVKVKVGDNFYKPKTVRVPAGTTIRWKNVGNVAHNVIPNKGKKFRSETMKPDDVFKFTFTTPGRYKYYCSFHGSPNVGHHGTIIVTAPPPTTAPPTIAPPAT